jgi:hypothetical protein
MPRPKRLSQSITAAQVTIEQLEAAFAEFRRSHKPGERIPDALRSRVLRALDQGVPERLIQKACGLSWIQPRQWRSRRVGRCEAPSSPPPRVLPVVEEEKCKAVASGSIEIGLGPWRVSVTHAA